MNVNGNQGSGPNYEPNTLNGPVQNSSYAWKKFDTTGQAGRYSYVHPNSDFEQPNILFRKVFTEEDRQATIENISNDMKPCKIDIKERMVKLWYKVDAELGTKIAQNVGVTLNPGKL